MILWQLHYNFLTNLGRMLTHTIYNSNAVCTMPKKIKCFYCNDLSCRCVIYKHSSIIYQILEKKKNKNYIHKTQKGVR